MSVSHLISLIVATRGRAAPFQQLFESLEAQTYRAFEVIVIDQNADDRVVPFFAERHWPFPIEHVRTPTEAGLSRGRNSGLLHAKGEIILFPDDDCWYPPQFLALAVARMAALGADVLTGRASDETGRDINGRYEKQAQRIDRANVWTTGIEWVAFFRRRVLDALGGYDIGIGVGAATPWQACEGQDIMLRALDRDFACFYDPALFGHHAELDIDDPSMLKKGRAYGRGLGYVLRLHRYPVLAAVNWIARPAVKAVLWLGRGHVGRFRYYSSVALGRSEGWLNRVAG
jgi:glycosyltransferase involved in cell wall biosynthesis